MSAMESMQLPIPCFFYCYILRIIKGHLQRPQHLPGVQPYLPYCHYYYGFGFLLGSAVFFLITALRLGYFTQRLPYYILSVQPIVEEDKSGRFTRLGTFLEEKLEGGEDPGEKK